ncbi:MAG TPA: hypothetical protein VFS97_08865 [Nitrososphaeraceae archaeon]|nr:hypothetical protein [Nitrososphaeraceae archaeon]
MLQSSLILQMTFLIGVLNSRKSTSKSTIHPPGSEVGPGAAGAGATWGTSVADEVDAMGFKWKRKGSSSKHIPFEWSGP